MSPSTKGELNFVDRLEEMNRIQSSLRDAGNGRGQLLLIRGEAGSGKTRLLQEATTEAERLGFSVGFGAGLIESVVPYQPWKEVLEDLGLASIMDEHPPPKLIGLYLIGPEGGMQTRVERKGITRRLISNLTERLAETVNNPGKMRAIDGGFTVQSQDGHRLLLRRGSKVHLAAIVEGRENEALLADMIEMTDNIESMFYEKDNPVKVANPQQAVNAHMQQLMDSEIYEGIDYSRNDPKLRQSKLFENVLLGLQRIASNSPLCVVIDDLQWADPSSLDLMLYVARNTRKTGALFLGTYRIEETESRLHLRSALKGMDDEELLSQMDLKGLSREYLDELAESFIGPHGLQDDFLDDLWQETRGFPLFIREVLLGLENDEKVVLRGAVKRLVCPLDEVELPGRVRDVIRARLNRIPKEDRNLLDAAATCGTRFTASLVSRVAGEDESKVLNGLSEIARTHGLLRPVDSGFTFDHPAVQEVLYENVPIEERRTYHRKVAEWLEMAGGPVEDIGEHYYQARDKRASAMLYKAASTARTEYANEEAIRFYDEALEFEENPENRIAILVDLGRICRLVGRNLESRQYFEDAMRLTSEKREKAKIGAEMASTLIALGEYDEALKVGSTGLELVQHEESPEEASCLLSLGNAYQYKCDYNKALESFEKGLAICEIIGDKTRIPGLLNNIGMVHGIKDDYDRALEYLGRSLVMKESMGDIRPTSSTLNNIGNVYNYRGDFDKAVMYYTRSLEICQKTGNLEGLGKALSNLGMVSSNRGNYEEALEYSSRSLDISRKIGNLSLTCSNLNRIGVMHRIQASHDLALDCYREGLSLAEKIGDKTLILLVLYNIGMVHYDREEYTAALEYIEKSLEISTEIGARWPLAETYCGLSEVYLKRGEVAKAMETNNRAMILSKELGRKGDMAKSMRIQGQIHRELEIWEDSIENFEDSIRIFADIQEEKYLADSHFEFGLMWKAKGDFDKAREHLEKALDIFGRLKLEKEIEKVNEALESLNAKSSSPRKVK